MGGRAGHEEAFPALETYLRVITWLAAYVCMQIISLMGDRKEHSPVHFSGPLTDLPFLEGHQSPWCSEWEIPSATPAPSLHWRTGTEAASPRKQTQLCMDIQQNECSTALPRSSCPWGRKIPIHSGSIEPNQSPWLVSLILHANPLMEPSSASDHLCRPPDSHGQKQHPKAYPFGISIP